MIFNNRVKYTTVIYIAFVIVILLIKPKFMFKKNGEFKAFGTGRKKTVLPFWLFILVAVMISYYLAHVLIFVGQSNYN